MINRIPFGDRWDELESKHGFTHGGVLKAASDAAKKSEAESAQTQAALEHTLR